MEIQGIQTGILLLDLVRLYNNMENKISVKCSDARAIQPILMKVQGADTAPDSDGKTVFS